MKAFVMVAGESTRMCPLTENRPKPLLPVGETTLLENILINVKKAGIKDFVFLVGYKKNALIDYFDDGKKWGVDIEYVEQKKRKGTGDAVKYAEKYLEDEIFLVNGDVLTAPQNYVDFIKSYKKNKKNIMCLAKVKYPEEYGVVITKDGKVTDILEKPKRTLENLVNAGMYILNKKIFDVLKDIEISPRGEYELTDALLKLDDLRTYELKDWWMDIGRPWDLLNINEILLKNIQTKIDGEVEKFVTIKGNVIIGEGTIVKNGTYIEGPVTIGKNCKVGPNAYIRPSTVIKDNCHIGAAVEIKNSVIMNNTNVPHHNYVGDSVIGENCNFGSGTKIANLRLDDKSVYVFLKGKKENTRRRKVGAFIGDNVKTGVNACIDVGTIIGSDSFIGPGVKVSGNISKNSSIV